MPQGIEGQGSAPASQIAQFRSDGFNANTGLRVPFFSDAFSRAFGFPDVRPVNMMSEETPIREERPYAAYVGLREVQYSRPGLAAGYNLGTGPIRGAYCRPGVFGGALFIVSGTTIYMNGASVGALPGTDLVRFAASPSQMVAVADGAAYLYDGVTFPTFTLISNGVLPAVVDVAYLAGRFAFACRGSATWYYSEINDAGNENGLDLANNNDSAAPVIGVEALNDQLVFLTASTVEFWSPGSDPTAPFTPNEGRGYQRGCAARDTVVFADNAVFFVGDNGVVYRTSNTPVRISSSSIEDKIRQCADWSALSALVVTVEGHELYVLNLPGVGSYAYDISRVGTIQGAYGDSYNRGLWTEWSSFGNVGFRAQVSTVVGGATFVGDATTNDLWKMQVGVWQDGADPLVRKASAFIKIEEGRPRMDGLVLHCVTGQGNAIPPGANSLVEMRYSDDQGRTFGRWRATPLGAEGEYITRAYWQRLGQMRAPGRLIEVRCSEPVDVAFSHLELNPLRAAN
ncbi:MAG: packaged DNA stabilization protein [Caulobacteraceae bacterium]